MKYLLFTFIALVLFPITSFAGDPVVIASNTGSQLGKAIYCGFETDKFAASAGRAIDNYSPSASIKEKALKQFILSATISAQTGPVTESCSEFRKGYDASFKILKEAGF